jgi:ABC-type glycerol-3-phosphate transport system substrate-binding protein
MRFIGRRTLGGLIAGVLLISGCGTSAPSPTATSGASSAAPGTSPGAPGPSLTSEPVTLNLWIFEGEEGILPKFKAGFEAAHPNITLEITLIPEDLYVTKLDTAFAAGSPPDIAYMYEPRWLKAGAFLPLDDVLASKSIDVARFAQGPLGGCQLDGKLYCLGSYLGLVVLLYDKQLFDAANLPYPSATVPMSIDEYAQVAAKLAKPNADLAKRVWGGEVAVTYWWQDIANLFSEDGRSVTGLVDDEATIHDWDVLGKMAKDGVGITSSEQEAAGLESTDLIATHQLGMAIADNIAVGDLQEQGVDVGVAPLPVEQAGQPVWASTWMDQWAVPTKSSHPDEAKELVAWIATEGNKIRMEAGTPPLDLSLALDSGWATDSPERQTLLDLAAQAKHRGFIPSLFSVLGPTLEDAFTRVLETGDAGSALREAAPILQEDLDREWATWDKIQ